MDQDAGNGSGRPDESEIREYSLRERSQPPAQAGGCDFFCRCEVERRFDDIAAGRRIDCTWPPIRDPHVWRKCSQGGYMTRIGMTVVALAIVPAVLAAQTDSSRMRDSTRGRAGRQQTSSGSIGQSSRGQRLSRDQVGQLQTALQQANCDPGTIDSVMGARTRRAMNCARKQNNITGNNNDELYRSLNLNFANSDTGATGNRGSNNANSGANGTSSRSGTSGSRGARGTRSSGTRGDSTGMRSTRRDSTRRPGTPRDSTRPRG
jgi:hypothetical protein